jgi:hypothetical protein
LFYSNTLRSDVFFQVYETRKYDFLWVFDNSASMAPRRDFVKNNMQNFLNIMNMRKAVDYQMALTDTDNWSHSGELVKNPSGLEVVASATSSNPVGDFASIVSNIKDSPTSFWEMGLESSYQAVYKHGSKFIRKGVPLVIVFLTDEEDWSCKDQCWGPEPENNTNWIAWEMSRYISYFQNLKKVDNADIAIFNIVGVPNSDCNIPSVGARYIELQTAIGGFGATGSICNSALAESYENIARTIADRGARFPLAKQTNGRGVNVYVNSELIPYSPENYIYEAETNSIIFTGALPKTGAIIEVSYSELMD